MAKQGELRIETSSYGVVKIPFYDTGDVNTSTYSTVRISDTAGLARVIPTITTGSAHAFDFVRVRANGANRVIHLGDGLLPTYSTLVTSDHSGNGHNLTQIGTSSQVSPDSGYGKFGEGRSVGTTDDYYRQSDAALNITGSLSIIAVVKFNNASGTQERILQWGAPGETLADNITYMLDRQSDGNIEYFHEYGTGNNFSLVSTGTPLSSAGTYVIELQRNATTGAVVVWVNGTARISSSYNTVTQAPAGGTSGQLRLGVSESSTSDMDGSFHEVRIWDSVVTSTTLHKIADPDDPDYWYKREGNEEACWFFESI